MNNYFDRFYSSIELAYTGRIILFRPDGTLVASYPSVDGAYGRSYADHVLFEHARDSSNGLLRGRGVLESDERLVAYRVIGDYRVLLVLSTPMSAGLHDWKRDSAIVVLAALLLAGLAGTAAFLLARVWRLTTSLIADAVEKQMRLDSIIASAMDAIITVDQQQNIILFNSAAEHIFLWSANEAIGGSLDRFIPDRFRGSHRAHVRAVRPLWSDDAPYGCRPGAFGPAQQRRGIPDRRFDLPRSCSRPDVLHRDPPRYHRAAAGRRGARAFAPGVARPLRSDARGP